MNLKKILKVAAKVEGAAMVLTLFGPLVGGGLLAARYYVVKERLTLNNIVEYIRKLLKEKNAPVNPKKWTGVNVVALSEGAVKITLDDFDEDPEQNWEGEIRTEAGYDPDIIGRRVIPPMEAA